MKDWTIGSWSINDAVFQYNLVCMYEHGSIPEKILCKCIQALLSTADQKCNWSRIVLFH